MNDSKQTVGRREDEAFKNWFTVSLAFDTPFDERDQKYCLWIWKAALAWAKSEAATSAGTVKQETHNDKLTDAGTQASK